MTNDPPEGSLFSPSDSDSKVWLGLVCLRRWAGRSPGDDLGLGGGSIHVASSTTRPLNFIGEGALSLSLPSIEPECLRRRAGIVGRSIFFTRERYSLVPKDRRVGFQEEGWAGSIMCAG